MIFLWKEHWGISMGENYWWRWFEKKDEQSFVGILGTRFFHLWCHQCQRGILLQAWMVWGGIVDMLLWWFVKFMTKFIIDLNIAVFYGIWQKNNGKIKLVWMASWFFTLSEVMGDTFEYLVYVVNVKRWNDKSGRSYVSFGDVCSEIEFAEACSSKLVISLSRIVILRIKVEGV